MENPIYVAITGLKHYYGTSFLKPGQYIQLIKEPDNPYDQEAIKAEIPPIGKIGYVANSIYTVPKGCRSAGRIYDSIDQQAGGMVRFVMKDTVIVELTANLEDFFTINMMSNVTFSWK